MTCGRISAFVTLWLPLSYSKGLWGSPLGTVAVALLSFLSPRAHCAFCTLDKILLLVKVSESIRECRIWLS